MDQPNYLPALQGYIDKMPSLPTSVTKILEICNDPKTSPADLNKVIGLDPVLMGKVMKLINSAYYGLSQEVTSLVRAIIMLGINTVKNLALSTAVLGTLGKQQAIEGLNMDGFWRHSLCVGVTAKLIAKGRKIDSKLHEEYFMAGILHDIGKIPLNNRLSKQYVMALAASDRDNSPMYLAEKKTLGLDHSEVGKLVVELWKLSPEIRDTVLHHHHPVEYTGQFKDIVWTVALANYFSNYYEIGFSGDRYPDRLPEEVFAYLGVSLEQLEDLEDKVNAEIEKARIFLKLAA